MTGMDEAAALLRPAQRVVIFTGAGMSAESGIPTFRDALTGLWERFDAQQLATPEAYGLDPALVWGWYEGRRAAVERVRPNAGHEAVAAIQARVLHSVLITQNIDDLHERAGSPAPIHLHGSLFAPRCSACAEPAPLPPAPAGEDGRIDPPSCAVCGASIRPGVVWFGEALPEEAFAAAVEAAMNADLLLTIGTSALVYPAAEIPQVAARFHVPVIQINPQPTPLDPFSTVNLQAPAAVVLPALVRTAWT